MKTKTLLVAIVTLLVSSHFAKAQDLTEFFSKADGFFKTYVHGGRVAYQKIKDDSATLDELLKIAASVAVSKDEPRNYQAFWINAYNLGVIKGIVDHYPIKSPLDKSGFFDKTTYDFGGKAITLNDLEHKLLRGNFPKEARFHFVLVCAGLGCPPIINEAYLPNTLEAQLQRQTEKALNNPNFVRVKGKKVLLSQIFEWYKGDFTQDGKSEISYINQFRKEKLNAGAKVGYYAYDWTLNEAK